MISWPEVIRSGNGDDGASGGSTGSAVYEFNLEERIPPDHLLRRIDAVLDLSWLRADLAPFYSHTGCPSVDPELMVRMLLIGYCYSIRSERRLCPERLMSIPSSRAPEGQGA